MRIMYFFKVITNGIFEVSKANDYPHVYLING